MDRAEIAKRVERAEKLLQKGKTDEALEEYLQILAADPTNDTICQMAADLCLSLQRIPQAVNACLGAMFERQIQAGDATRASLTYKKLARFVNPTWEQKVRFGELLENTNRKLALETYEKAFEEMSKQGRKPDSLSVLQARPRARFRARRNCIRLAELSSKLGDSKACRGGIPEARGAWPELPVETAATGSSALMPKTPPTRRSLSPTAKACWNKGRSGPPSFVLEPVVSAGSASQEIRETYAKALLAANRLS